jgi:hypothetical protein
MNHREVVVRCQRGELDATIVENNGLANQEGVSIARLVPAVKTSS